MSSLYDPVLVSHARAPRHRGRLEGAVTAMGVNRPCGDTLHMHLRVDEGRCVIAFEGEGCALALASASALCEVANGLDEDGLAAIIASFHEALTSPQDEAKSLPGDLSHFLAVRAVPSRIGCVRLAPRVLLDCIAKDV